MKWLLEHPVDAKYMNEYHVRRELHLSTHDIETMDFEKYSFFSIYMNELAAKQARNAKRAAQQTKARKRR